MKKQIILGALAFFSVHAFAQQAPKFGIRGGVVHATISGDAAGSLNSIVDYTNGAVTSSGRTGFFGGAYASVPVSSQVSIEPGILYTQKGYQLRGGLGIKGAEFIGANAQAKLTAHYIDVPVLVKANFGGLQLFAGPQMSYLAGANLRTTAGLLGFNLLNKTINATEQFNRWDAALTGGVGYQFGNGINISASYDHGLSRIDKGNSMNAYNRGVKVGVGIAL